MRSSGVPSKFPIPFASGAGSSYVRTIPQADQSSISPGAASLTTGFPPTNFGPKSAGNIPPDGRDVNGILLEVTQALQWSQAGGLWPYDGGFAAAIGGYPADAIVPSNATAGKYWVNLVDQNTTDPDSAGAANWQDLLYPEITRAENAEANIVNAIHSVYDAAGQSYSAAFALPIEKLAVRLGSSNANTITASATLTADSLGTLPINAASGNIAITLPAASCVALSVNGSARLRLHRVDAAPGNTVTITTPGGNLFGFTSGSISSTDLMIGETLELYSDGATQWFAIRVNSQRVFSQYTAGAFSFPVPIGCYVGWIDAVAGGGGGGATGTGGGAAGGSGAEFHGSFRTTPGQNITGTIGAAGAGSTDPNGAGASGSSTTLDATGWVASGGQGGASGNLNPSNHGGDGGTCFAPFGTNGGPGNDGSLTNQAATGIGADAPGRLGGIGGRAQTGNSTGYAGGPGGGGGGGYGGSGAGGNGGTGGVEGRL